MIRIRTGYSFRQAAGHVKEVAQRLKEIGAQEAPITDRASTFGWLAWKQEAEALGLRPIYGVELAVTADIAAKKPVVDYWTFLARDSLKPINDLVALATSQFRYQPLLRMDQALDAVGACSVMVGHRAQLAGLKPPEGPVAIGLTGATSRGYLKAAIRDGWRLVATGDNRFPRAEDKPFYEVLVGKNAEVQTYPQHILSAEEWWDTVRTHVDSREIALALDRAEEWRAASTAVPLRAELPHPPRPDTLEGLCRAGAAALGIDLENEVYKARLLKELSLIEQKGYEDYFYIVADLVQWARKRMIVGPARGSSCGSLVCYLLGITRVDPIPYGLIFERFVDVNRTDMPDIDIDFSDQERWQVFDYLASQYGPDHVARLGTVAYFRPRSALAEIGPALRIPPWVCTAVTESLIERSSGDSRALQTLEDTLATTPAGRRFAEKYPNAMVITRFEGHPRHYSQHAAGVVIASEPISKYVAIDNRTHATMCDKEDAEKLNLLKIDALGLTQLSIFEDTISAAGLEQSILDEIPLEDQAAFDILNAGSFSGIFQFNGIALQSITEQFKVTRFNDIVSITALGRPGPLASGGAHEWVRRKNGISPITYPHPLFEPYLSDTLGIPLYQEQVMEIGRNIGNLSWADVSALRKAMSKSLGKEYFDQFGDPWKAAAIAKGVAPKDAEKIWDDLCAYGAMGFNKSHAVAYGLISYWCCWFKAHYPHEFAAASLTHEKNPDAQIKMLREMESEGFIYEPFDADLSADKWRAVVRGTQKVLLGPLTNVEGVGPKGQETLLSARARGERPPDALMKRLNAGKTKLHSLWPISDAFKRLIPDPLAVKLHSPVSKIGAMEKRARDYEVVLFCTFIKINPRDENEEIMVARRGHRIEDGMETSLNLQMMDDTGQIFGKVSRYDYAKIGPDIVDRGRSGKALYLVKGLMRGHRGDPSNTFKMVSVKRVRYIGDLDVSLTELEPEPEAA